MAGYDIADPDDPNTLRVPFVFVPHGAPMPEQWMAEHPHWVRIPATFVPREQPEEAADEPDWNQQSEAIDSSMMPQGQPAAEPAPEPAWPPTLEGAARGGTAPDEDPPCAYDMAANVAAWREAEAVFAEPVGASGLRMVPDSEAVGWPYEAQLANKLLGFAPKPISPIGLVTGGYEPDTANDDRATAPGPATDDDPGAPQIAKYSDGSPITDPMTHKPLLQPPGVSLSENAALGREMSSLGPIAKRKAMLESFRRGSPMDYHDD